VSHGKHAGHPHNGHDHDHSGHDHDHGDHGHAHGRGRPNPTREHVHGVAGLHAPEYTTPGDQRRMLVTLIITAALMVTEFLGGILSGSLALKSDAAHLLTDVAALALSLFALLIAARPADVRRTYGYYRLEILAALTNGLVLIALSGYVLWAAYERFRTPVPVRADLVMAFALVGLIAMGVGMWLLHGSHSLNVRGAYLHVAGDALTSIAVLAGGALMHFRPGLTFVDPLLSTLIGLAVIASAFRLIKEAVDVLLEAVPRDIDLSDVVHSFEALEGVTAVHDLHIWTITSGMHALSAHVVVAELAPGAHDALLTRIKQMLLDRYKIAHSTVQLESCSYEHVGHDAPPG
jgi:cobalt-zinc-cadmium efflux system protein